MNYLERKIVLDYLYHTNYHKGFFIIVNKIISKNRAQRLFEDMTLEDRKLILKKIVVDYLALELSGSMICYYVNGTPLKRYLRIREIAHYKYINMDQDTRDFIYKKILYN